MLFIVVFSSQDVSILKLFDVDAMVGILLNMCDNKHGSPNLDVVLQQKLTMPIQNSVLSFIEHSGQCNMTRSEVPS